MEDEKNINEGCQHESLRINGYQPSESEQRGYQPKPNGNFGYQPANNSPVQSTQPPVPTTGSNAIKPKTK